MTDIENAELDKRDDLDNFFDELGSLVDRFSAKMQSEIDTARTVRATLIANFGNDSGRKIAGIEVDETQSTVKMLVDVLDSLVKNRPDSPFCYFIIPGLDLSYPSFWSHNRESRMKIRMKLDKKESNVGVAEFEVRDDDEHGPELDFLLASAIEKMASIVEEPISNVLASLFNDLIDEQQFQLFAFALNSGNRDALVACIDKANSRPLPDVLRPPPTD